ncbi:MAG: polysaccharide biosynthesis/export family protein [Chlamydiota bacterium]|nr:polysaccharide biosynthesis/export family protein [Chlamydiota bacterium]
MSLVKKARNLFVWIFCLFVLSGCCSKSSVPCIKGCRRPPVIVTKESCVIDYEDCLKNFRCVEEYALIPVDSQLVTEKPDPSNKPYRLVKGDVVQVNIYGEEDGTRRKVTVAPDGYIYYAYLEGIYALGKTLEEIRVEMENKLSHLYVDPNVTLNLVHASDYSFTILGRVSLPGVYPMIDSLRLREAIAMAGGLLKEYDNDKAINSQLFDLVDLENSFVVRDNKKIKPDFDKLLRSCDNSQNIYLEPGDYIFLAPRKSEAVYVVGAAVIPTRVPYVKDLTVSETLADGHGWITFDYEHKAADLSRVLVVRGSLESPKTIEINIRRILSGDARDFYLMPGDIVYVQNKNIRFGRELVSIAIRTFVDAFGLSAGSYWGLQWFPNGESN